MLFISSRPQSVNAFSSALCVSGVSFIKHFSNAMCFYGVSFVRHFSLRFHISNPGLFWCNVQGVCCSLRLLLLYIPWNTHQLCFIIGENCLVWFQCAGLINLYTANPGYWQLCVQQILPRSALWSDDDEPIMRPMLPNMKIDMSPLTSIIILSKLLTM